MRSTRERLRALVVDERGTLYEIPLIIVLVLVMILAAVRQPTLGRAALAALIAAGVFVGIFAVLIGTGFLLGWVSEVRWVNRVLESKAFRFVADWLPVALLSLFLGAAGAFFGIVLAEALLPTPAAQVRAGILTGLALAAVPVLWRLWALRTAKSAPPTGPGRP